MSDYQNIVQDLEEVQAKRRQMLEAMERHLQESASALATISWDKLDARGMLDFALAHATLSLALATALQAES